MIFALLLAAVIWNLATWYVGLPNSSSHALIGSILGVGLANQLIARGPGGTSGVDWSQATKVLNGLWMAPVIGFFAAMVLLLLMKVFVKNPALYREPDAGAPPPKGIRALLIATCTAVSFAHGSNDGQKGMGLIMLILIGVRPDRLCAEPDDARERDARPMSRARRPRRRCWRARARARRSSTRARRSETALSQRKVDHARGLCRRRRGQRRRDRADPALWRAPQCARRGDAEPAQRHVSGARYDAADREGRAGGVRYARS